MKLVVYCRCGRQMLFSIEGYACLARTRWNFFWHDKNIQYRDARKLVDKKQTS